MKFSSYGVHHTKKKNTLSDLVSTMFSYFFFSAFLVAVLSFSVYKIFLSKFDFYGIGNVLWYRFVLAPLPPQEVTWLQNWQDKVSKLADLGVHSSQIQQTLPNILFILADDLGYNDLSDFSYAPDAHGLRQGAHTPHINSIRNNGIDFVQSYSGHSTCTPSRTALLTGRYATKLGIEYTPTPPFVARFATRKRSAEEVQPIYHEEFYDGAPYLHNLTLIPREVPMIADYLDHAGYHNYFFGKWDSGYGPERSPLKHGFDEALCFPYGGSQYSYSQDPDIVSPPSHGVFNFNWLLTEILGFFVQHNDGPRFHPDRYMTDYLTEQAVSLLHALHTKAQNHPWFIMMAYNAPHNPFQARRMDYDAPELAHVPEGLPRIYAAMIRALDRGVGRLIETLKATNQYENTIIIFTSDNGGAEYARIAQINAPFRGWKLSLFEGGIRVPFFLQWPLKLSRTNVNNDDNNNGNNSDRNDRKMLGKIHQVISHIDVVPTLVDMIDSIIHRTSTTGPSFSSETDTIVDTDHVDTADTNTARPLSISQPQAYNVYKQYIVDGISFWPAVQAVFNNDNRSLKIMETSNNRTLFWRSGHYQAIRTGDWKLQRAQHPNKVWFFDLSRDPTEQVNIADVYFHLHTAEEVTAFCALLLSDANHDSGHIKQPADNANTGDESEKLGYRDALCATWQALIDENAQHGASLWQALYEVPLCIDKTGGGFGAKEKCRPTDEYVIVPN